MELFKLFGSILVDNAAANQSIAKTEEKAEGLGKKFLSGVGTAAKWGAAIGGAAIAGAAAIGGLAMRSAEATDRIDKLSARTGLSKKAFQEWDYVLGQNGVNIEVMKNGMKTLTKFMAEAADGNEDVYNKFEQLGVALFDTTGKLREQEDVMKDTLKSLADLPNGAEKAALATELFGKAGSELMPMLNNGSASIDELTKRAHELGLVMSDDAIAAGVKLGDTMDDVKKSFGAITTQLGVQFMPAVQAVLEWVLSAMPTIQVIMGGTFNLIGDLVSTVSGSINTILIPAFQMFFSETSSGAEGFQGTMQGLWDFIEPLMQDLQALFQTILKAIAGFWKTYGDQILNIVKPLFDTIKVIIETAMNLIRGIIRIVTGLIKGDWEQVWNGLKQITTSVMDGIKQILPNLLEAIRNVFILAIDGFLNAGKGIFNAVWDGMKAIWDKLTTWVSDKVTWLADKLAFWRSSKAEMSDGGSSSGGSWDGSHANGLSYVPFDGYIAQLHRGERVLTAKENEQYNQKASERSGDTNYFFIDKMYNGDGRDTRDFAEEFEFYRRQKEVT